MKMSSEERMEEDGHSEGRKEGTDTQRESLTRWSDSHVLLAVHDEAPHRLAIWIVGRSLTYCGCRRRQREGEREGTEWSISTFN